MAGRFVGRVKLLASQKFLTTFTLIVPYRRRGQVEPRNCGADLSDGREVNLLNQNVFRLATDINQKLIDAANFGVLQMNLDTLGFSVQGPSSSSSVCEAPSDMKMYTHQLDRKSRQKHLVEFDRCSTMVERGGTRALDQKCRRELLGILLMVGLLAVLVCLCCLRILASCDCAEAKTRRQRIADSKVFSAFEMPASRSSSSSVKFERLGQGYA